MDKTEASKNETSKQGNTAPENAIEGRKTVLTANRLETVVAVLLGVTTLLSAWAAWIGHLHGGLQSIHFTESNNTAAQSTAEYNLGMQAYLADYMVWNTLRDYNFELEAAKADGDQTKIDLYTEKIKTFKKDNISETLDAGIKWMEKNNADNPFNMPGMAEKYAGKAQKTAAESQSLLEEGKHDNTKGDSYQLVTVIYSLVLFLLGIVGTFKNMPNRIAVLAIAVVCLIFAFVYMCTIPLPTGFAQMNFFEFNQ